MADEQVEKTKEMVVEIIQRLRQTYPTAHCALNYETAHQLLIATILSAQCTDERVNKVTPALFARYPTIEDLAGADREELEALIRTTGFFHQKAKFIQETCQKILHWYGGEVPNDMRSLIRLPGVARKTANVVLGEIFHKSEGITVDTHVKRLANRLGLTHSTDAAHVEQDLMAIVPLEEWIMISHWLIFHGRRVCDARKPKCHGCVLQDLCPSAQPAYLPSQGT